MLIGLDNGYELAGLRSKDATEESIEDKIKEMEELEKECIANESR